MANHRKVYGRGQSTVELPFLMSCIVDLLDQRLSILGIRYPWRGTRFDLVACHRSLPEHIVLVEAKYRGDDRPVRPYEIRAFQKTLEKTASLSSEYKLHGCFMTNTRFSVRAMDLVRQYGMKGISSVRMIFELKKENGTGNPRE